MAEPRFWQSASHPASLALTPLALIYRAMEALNRKLTHAQHPGKPVICVGNLTAGGGGKTPTVRWLSDRLKAKGLSPAVLSRGYGGSEKGPLKVNASLHNAQAVGDEPLMLAADWPVYIGAERMQSLRLAVQDGANVLVKDDGFQNPAMAHHFNLIVVDGQSGLGNQRLLPAGPMRQPLHIGLAKLDALLVLGEMTHPSLALLMDAVEAFGKPVFHGQYISATEAKPKSNLHAFCGIAKPEKFHASLKAHGLEIIGHSHFADHHNFTEAEAEKLLALNTPLITTEKDMARLKKAPKESARARLAEAAHVLNIALQIENEADLLAAIEQSIADGQANRLYKSY